MIVIAWGWKLEDDLAGSKSQISGSYGRGSQGQVRYAIVSCRRTDHFILLDFEPIFLMRTRNTIQMRKLISLTRSVRLSQMVLRFSRRREANVEDRLQRQRMLHSKPVMRSMVPLGPLSSRTQSFRNRTGGLQILGIGSEMHSLIFIKLLGTSLVPLRRRR